MLNRDFVSIVDGSTFGSKMPRASWEFVGSMPLCLPSDSEQDDIAAFLDRETAKIDAGPIFRRVRGNKDLKVQDHRLECTRPYYIIKRAARGIGLDASNIGSHSLRSGCVTWLLLQGVTPWHAMTQSGHRSVRSVMHYFRASASPQNSPLSQTRWVR